MLNVKAIKELMRDMHINNVSTLARVTNIPYTTLNYMFNGHDMKVGTIIELSKFFGVPIDYLISKPYNVVVYTDKGEEVLETASLIEAMVSTTL